MDRRSFVEKCSKCLPVVGLIAQSCYYNKLEPTSTKETYLKLLFPNGGEKLWEGDVIRISWESRNLEWVNIKLSKNGGVTWDYLAQKVAATSQKIELKFTGNSFANGKVCVEDYANAQLTDVSDAFFEYQTLPLPSNNPIQSPDPNPQVQPTPPTQPIQPPSTTVSSPVPAYFNWKNPMNQLTFLSGEQVVIHWETNKTGKMTLYYQTNVLLGWIKLDDVDVSQTSSYTWTVPSTNTTQAKIKAEDDTGFESISYTFSIRRAEAVSLDQYPSFAQINDFFTVSSLFLGDFIVFKTDTSYRVLELACTHSGCLTTFQSNQFTCPCHGSSFDAEGNVINGPARRPLGTLNFKYQATNRTLLVY